MTDLIPEDHYQPSKDFSYVIVAVDSAGDAFVLDCSQGFSDAEAFINGCALNDSCVSTSETLDCLSVYRLSNFHFWTSTDWESGIVDDSGWEAEVVEKLFQIPV